MDFREPDRYQQPEPTGPVPVSTPPERRRRGKGFLKLLLVLILIGGAAAGGWYYRTMQAEDDAKVLFAEIDNLEALNEKLQSDLKTAQDKASKAEASQPGPSEDTLKKVQDAVKGGKYADMQSLIASKVNVIIAASEGLGQRTPAQAVADLKYLDSGTDPWNFALASAVINGYQDGDYAQYFPEGALVGKSANDYVVSFVFNNSGKVIGIFMAADADLL